MSSVDVPRRVHLNGHPLRHVRSRRLVVSVGVLTAAAVLVSGLQVAAAPVAAPALAQSAPAPSGQVLLSRPDVASAQAAARVEGARVRVEADTTEDSLTYVEPNGSFTRETAIAPVRVRRGEEWVDIDSTLVARDGAIGPQVGKGLLRLSPGDGGAPGGTDLVSLADEAGRGLAVRWPGRLPAPALEGDTATYGEVLPGVDVTVQATRTGFKDAVVLKSATAATAPVWRFPLTLTRGVRAEQRPDGTIVFVDGTGRTVAATAPALMWDAQRDPVTGDPTRTAPVATKLVSTGAGPELQLTPDAAFLSDPATRFPVTIDPSTHLGEINDHWVSIKTDGSGTTYNSSVSPSEVRVGYYSGGTAKHRGYIAFDTAPVEGQYINSATLGLYQWNSTSCTSLESRIYGLSQGFTDSTLWPGPGAHSTIEASSTACAVGWQRYDVTGLTKKWASKQIANHGMLVRSADENQTGMFWRFYGASYTDASKLPSLAVNYNRRPHSPSSLYPVSGSHVRTTTPALSTLVSDPDGQQVRGQWFIKDSAGNLMVNGGMPPTSVPSGSRSSYVVPADRLLHGQTYTWQVRGHDGLDPSVGYVPSSTDPQVSFTVDTQAPAGASAIGSAAFPAGSWQSSETSTGSFNLSHPASDVTRFFFRLNDGPVQQVAASWNGSASVATTPQMTPGRGWHTLHVQAADRAGNTSPSAGHSFGVASALTAPSGGAQTAGTVPLQAQGPAGATGITFQYAPAGSTEFKNLESSEVTLNGTAQPMPVTPVTSGSVASAPQALVWDAAKTLSARLGSASGPISVRAVFTGYSDGSTRTTGVATVTVDPVDNAAASTQVEPGSVNLRTGNFSVGATDAVASAYAGDLSVSRTFHSRAAGAAGVFGPGWKSSLPGGDSSGLLEARDTGGAVTLVDDLGGLSVYTRNGTSYLGTGEAAADGSVLVGEGDSGNGPTSFTLTDLDGTQTRFSAGAWTSPASSSAPHLLKVTGVTTPGQGQSTTYGYDTSGRVEVVYAPAPPGVTCPNATNTDRTWAAGCRGLLLTYDTAGLMTVARLKTHDTTLDLACYRYDSGRLAQVWDPRLGGTGCASTPMLPVSYGYDSNGRLASITPPGLAAYRFGYATGPDGTSGWLGTVSRTRSNGTVETDTVRYGVNIGPATGTDPTLDDSHPDLAAREAWAQASQPVSAAAVFGPGEDPADLRQGSVHALDVDGREVNTASFSGSGQRGWRIATTDYDRHGNTVRILAPGNRDAALWPTAEQTERLTLPVGTTVEASAARARMLDTVDKYSPDGIELRESFGPLHQLALPSGTLAAARQYTRTVYGTHTTKPAPGDAALTGGGPKHSPITVSVGASLSGDTTATSLADVRVTQYDYALHNNGGDDEGWALSTPLRTTVEVPGGTNIHRIDRYDPVTGVQTRRQQPSDSPATSAGGTGAGTTVLRYYTAGSHPDDAACGNTPARAGLLCKTAPAAQPGTTGLPNLPVTQSFYDDQLRVIKTVETIPGVSTAARTSVTEYEHAGMSPRVLKTSTSGGQGTALLAVVQRYDSSTGLPTEQLFENTTTAIKTGYDEFGRQSSYTNADGELTNTGYDNRGRVEKVSSPKNTLTYGYDAGGERRGLVTSVTASAISTASFTGSYNADGQLTRQVMPDGLEQQFTLDETGDAASVTYTRSGTVLLTDSQTSNVHSQWRSHSGFGSSQLYNYDNAGRLTKVDDTVGSISAATCTRRAYTFDVNSNRKTLTRFNPNPDTGDCTDSSGGSSTNGDFDSADRLLATGANSGLVYDEHSRVTELPAGSSGTSTTTSIRYYNTDWVRELHSNGKVRTWDIDPAGRRRSMTEGTAVTRSHYDSSDDNPAWITDPNGSLSIYTSGLNRSLAAVTTVSGTSSSTAYQLVNLHGDIATTVPASSNTLSASLDTDEYGNPRSGSTPRYGWLGAHQRSGEAFGGLLLMGVRLYSPNLGRFLSPDSVLGGGANAYAYPTDPVNVFDLDGKRWTWLKKTKSLLGVAAFAACVASVGCGAVTFAAVLAGVSYRATTTFSSRRSLRSSRKWATFGIASTVDVVFIRFKPVRRLAKHNSRGRYGLRAALQNREGKRRMRRQVGGLAWSTFGW